MGAEQNAWQQRVLGRAQGRNRENITLKFDRLRQRQPFGWAKRGMMNSGLYSRARSQFQQDRATTLSQAEQQYLDQLSGLQLAQGQLGRVREMGIQDIDEAQQARIAAIAAALRGASY